MPSSQACVHGTSAPSQFTASPLLSDVPVRLSILAPIHCGRPQKEREIEPALPFLKPAGIVVAGGTNVAVGLVHRMIAKFSVTRRAGCRPYGLQGSRQEIWGAR